MLGSTPENAVQKSAIDKVFYPLFVLAYFKQNAGLFVFLFVLFFNSFFYINYLGKMPANESFFWHFILVITLVRNQFMVMLFMGLSSFFNLKSLYFVKATIRRPASNFIFLSFVALPQWHQYFAWLRLQCKLNVPLLIYGLFCLMIAAKYGQVMYGIVILVYLMLLIILVALYHFMSTLNYKEGRQARFADGLGNQSQIRLLILNYLFKKQPVGIFITKVISILLLYCMHLWGGQDGFSWRVWSLMVLIMAAAHGILVYKSARFLSDSFPVPGNLPMSWPAAFLFPLWSYVVFLLPELLLFVLIAPGAYFIFGLIMMLSFLMVYHHLACHLNFNLKQLLKVVFLLLCVCYLLTLYQFFLFVPFLNFAIALKLFKTRFHLQEEKFF